MQNGSRYLVWAGAATGGLLLFFVIFSGWLPMAEIPLAVLFIGVLAALVMDNVRRGRALRELQREEQRLAKLVEDSPAGIGIYVFEKGVLKSGYLNQGYYDMLGVDKEKRMAERKEFMQFVHPDDLPAVLAEIQKDVMEERDFCASGSSRATATARFPMARSMTATLWCRRTKPSMKARR